MGNLYKGGLPVGYPTKKSHILTGNLFFFRSFFGNPWSPGEHPSSQQGGVIVENFRRLKPLKLTDSMTRNVGFLTVMVVNINIHKNDRMNNTSPPQKPRDSLDSFHFNGSSRWQLEVSNTDIKVSDFGLAKLITEMAIGEVLGGWFRNPGITSWGC